MCGRFALSAPVETIRQHFKLREDIVLQPRYNIAPSQQVAVVREAVPGVNKLVMMRWGLVPSWASDLKFSNMLINARAETLHQKPSFSVPFKKSRCLLPADGFYEWRAVPGLKTKQPYLVRMQNGGVFAFGGLWSSWKDKTSGEIVESCTIITTEPNILLAEIHNRMPVIIQPDHYATWLGQHSDPAALKELFSPVDPAGMICHPVSTLCNSTKIDSPDCIVEKHKGM